MYCRTFLWRDGQGQALSLRASSQLSYIIRGSGPGLLLAHGAGATVQSCFSALLGLLAEQFTVIGPDYPGSGATPRSLQPLQLDMLVDQMVATAVQAGVEKFAMLGYSLGCAVALRAATRHPDRVMALILTSGFAQLDTVSRLKAQTLRNLVNGGDLSTAAQLLTNLTISEQYINSISEEELRGLIELVTSGIASGAVEQTELGEQIDVRPDLPKVSVPTLVINATQDRLLSPQLGKALAAGIPGAQIAELNCGHLPIDRGREWLGLIQHFLAMVASPLSR